MKKRKVMTCLVVGVLVLAVSATAAFGSVNGYARYKEAVKALALETDNFSAVGTASMTVDGQAVWSVDAEAAMDGPEKSTYFRTTQDNHVEEDWNATVGDQHIWFSTGTDSFYHSYPANDEGGPYNMLGFSPDDEYSNRLITFFEVACDTVVGELKNNFVQVGTQDGVDLYQVDIAQAQVPSLVSAGLSLFAYAVTQDTNDTWYATYEDFDATRFHYYETQTGETLPQEFKDAYSGGWSAEWQQENQDMIEKFDAVCYGEDGSYWGEVYDKVLEENNGGVVYVYADGSYDYYSDQASFLEDHPEEAMDHMETYFGEDLALDNIHCTFGVDREGNLTENQISVTFVTTGQDGLTHELVISGEVALSDFGTTTVTMPDVGDRTEVYMG